MNWRQLLADPDSEPGLRQQIGLAALAILVILSHRPDALLSPQFFAEDGAVWYHDAYMHGGLHVLFAVQGGQLHLLQRLAAALVQLVPLKFAPFCLNVTGMCCQVLVVNLLASRRLALLVPDLRVRLVMGFVYLGMPDSWEVLGLFTTAHWHLAVAACILIVGQPSRERLWRWADGCLLMVAVLSGPFAIFLFGMAAVIWWLRRERWSAIVVGVAACGVLAQALIMLTVGMARSTAPLAATPQLFAKILGTQVFLVGVVGQNFFYNTLPPLMDPSGLVLGAFFFGIAVYAYTLWRSPWPLRLFVGFALAVLAASMTAPLVSTDSLQWPKFLYPGVGGRYWMIPRLAFLISLYWIGVHAKPRLARIPAKVVLLLLLPAGMAMDWNHRPFPEMGWTESVGEFYRAKPGTVVELPIQPPGWTLKLEKK